MSRNGAHRPSSQIMLMSAVIFVFAALAGTQTASAHRATPQEPERTRRLLVIGDSVLLGAQAQIPAALPGWHVEVDAAVSRSTQVGVDVVAARGTDFDVVVVQLGTNDGGSPGIFEPRAAAVLDALASVPQVYWLTIREARPYYANTNAIVRRLVDARPNAGIGDWNARSGPGDVAGDGLHLTPSGATKMAALISELANGAEAGDRPSTPAEPPAEDPPPEETTTTESTTTSTTSTTTSTTTTTSTSTVPPTTVATPAPEESSGGGASVWPWVVGVVVVAAGGGAFAFIRLRRKVS